MLTITACLKILKKPLDFCIPLVIYFWYAKGGDGLEHKKMGRPTDNPKGTQIAVRLDNQTLKILDTYCEREKVTRAEGVRVAIRKLEKE